MTKRTLVPTLVATALVVISPFAVAAQGPGPDGPGPRGMFGGAPMLDRLVESAEEIGLTAEQVGALEALRDESLDRTADARAVLDEVRDGGGDVVVADVRKAREALAEEARVIREEIAATLTEEQMAAMREEVDVGPRRAAFRGGPGGPRPGGPRPGGGGPR